MEAGQPDLQKGVQAWQEVLAKLSYAPGKADGYFGPKTQQATLRFQKENDLLPDGVVGPNTLAKAQEVALKKKIPLEPSLVQTAAQGEPKKRTQFEIGPHREDDIRECRPYFLALLPRLVSLEAGEAVTQAIQKRIRETVADTEKDGRPITDIYVLSHGWHRNFFGAVAAYDRLVSRFSALRRRERLIPLEGDAYSPLFITLHWHSDPGENRWEDGAGRRHKRSFLQNIRDAFEIKPDDTKANVVTETDLVNDFEDIFELFSNVSAPGVGALSGALDESSKLLLDRLDTKYNLRLPPRGKVGHATRAEKVATAWTCYNMALPKRVLVSQDEKPNRFNTLFQAVGALIKFAVGLFGIVAVLTQLLKIPNFWEKTWSLMSEAGRGLVSLPILRTLWSWESVQSVWQALAQLPPRFAAMPWWGQYLAACVVALPVLAVTGIWRQRVQKDQPAKGLPIVALAAWLPLQLFFTLPLFVFTFLPYLLGGPFAWLTGNRPTIPLLFDERFGQRNRWDNLEQAGAAGFLRYQLARFARMPLYWLSLAVAKDSQVTGGIDTITSQLAFWEMQKKGVEAGRDAANFLETVFRDSPSLANARLHFIGHSFGSLVVANAARTLALRKAKYAANPQQSQPPPPITNIHSLCLAQGALASHWFEQEEYLRQFVTGSISCIYSRYDTANGFYYPMANSGRFAAGYVGLFSVGQSAEGEGYPVTSLGKSGEFVSLTQPINLAAALQIQGALATPSLINLDASRLIYEGPPASGGGHTDIFKDDVVHLVWSVMLLPQAPPAPPPPVSAPKEPKGASPKSLVAEEPDTPVQAVTNILLQEAGKEAKTE